VQIGARPDIPLIALLPGSRANEVREILPPLIDAAERIRAHLGAVQFVLARAPHLDDALFDRARQLDDISIVEGQTDQILAAADVALLASGTVTVQAALHECPMVVVYRLSPLTYRLGKPFVRVDTYAMANLVAGRRVVPELIQDALTPEAVAREAIDILTNGARASRMRAELREVRQRLGDPGASRRAAAAVMNVVRARSGCVG
jgi:lipid-A-disaccharide synthase